MPERPGSHLDYADRCVIEEGLAENRSASEMAWRLGASSSTVVKEANAARMLSLHFTVASFRFYMRLKGCADLAAAVGHVNSYLRVGLRGRCPVDMAAVMLPEGS